MSKKYLQVLISAENKKQTNKILLGVLKKKLVEIEKLSVEEVPMISFSKLDGNKKFLNWITKTIG